ncbi:uncharacterized protein LOC124404264 isoform X1 [Diprion similis]|uniref:uncharacterized protein LOC124404264 isoform X1 n=1 Tax=Diprion similis TaxID=362088 RepID=UPI001EF77812|nr:uncharacterized protein LOC124404264 isoform X1 [Diprion similis]
MMGKPKPSAPEPDLQPPPYSSLMASQSQGTYTLVPVESSQPSPYPAMAPVQQDTTPYHDRVNQVSMENGKPMSQPVFNSTSLASTTYDPMANALPTPRVISPSRTIVVATQTAISRRIRFRLYLKIFVAMGAILLGIVIGVRLGQKWKKQKQLQEEWVHDEMRWKFQEDFRKVDGLDQNRYQRSLANSALPPRDYDFEALNRATIGFVKQLPQFKNSESRPTVYDADHRFGHSLFKRNTRNKHLQRHVRRRYVKPNDDLGGTPMTNCS